MRYVKVEWEHDFPDDPVVYFSEIGEDNYEVRKVQLYRDGRSEWTNGHNETATVGLSEIPFPSVEEISSQSDCRAELVTSEEFERAWSAARASA